MIEWHLRHKHHAARRVSLGICMAAIVGLLMLPATAPALAESVQADPSSPTFSITSPFFNGVPEGPVGTYVSVSATSGWTPSATIVISVTPASSSCASGTPAPVPAQTTSPATVTVNPDGSFAATFQWPADANTTGSYAICANEENGGTQVGQAQQFFTVLSSGNGQPSSAPTVSVTTATTTVHNGDQITVTGTNWLPAQQVSLLLQYANQTLTQDSGEQLQQVTSKLDGTFSQQITLNTPRQNGLWVLALGGQSTQDPLYPYPLMAHSHAFTISAAPPPTVTPTPLPPTATPKSTGVGVGSGQQNTNQQLLILLLGLIAVVLLVAGIVVAILALRGRTPSGPPPSGGWGPSGPNTPGWGGNYAPGAPWDETQVGGPQQWDGSGNVAGWDDNWQGPAGQPWSGRQSRETRGPVPPSPRRPYNDDAEDDPYQTRMGQQPYQPPPSRPTPGGPPWDDDPSQGQPTSPWEPQH